jgi:hypothetical protein
MPRSKRNAKAHQDRQGVPEGQHMGRQEEVAPPMPGYISNGKGGWINVPAALDSLRHQVSTLQQQIDVLRKR